MTERTYDSWPKCNYHEGCIGVQLATSQMCLAHASDEEREAALKVIKETGNVDGRGVPFTSALLERVLAAAPRADNGQAMLKASLFDRATFMGDARFGGATFNGAAQFTGATFSGDAGFEGAIFSGDARFGHATFMGDAGFGGATFSGEAGFGHARFMGGAWFEKARFTGGAWFETAIFSGGALFNGARFTGGARFGGAEFSGIAGFGEAIFTGDALFTTATFTGVAGFTAARFTGTAGFEGATFSGHAWFEQTTFTRDARFMLATFRGDAWFGMGTFSGGAWFGGARFTSGAEFGEATFSGDADFGGATFRRLASFSGARFEQAREFGPMLAHRGLVLDDAQFAQPVQIEVSTIGLSSRRARFPAGVQFRLRWARVVLDDANFPAPSLLTGVPNLADTELAAREDQIARSWQRLLGKAISEQPQLLSLRRANVEELGLSNVTAADCRFAGAHNLDRLRLEANVAFAAAPSPLGRLSWEGRQAIAEECALRARRGRRWGWSAPSWPDWLVPRP